MTKVIYFIVVSFTAPYGWGGSATAVVPTGNSSAACEEQAAAAQKRAHVVDAFCIADTEDK